VTHGLALYADTVSTNKWVGSGAGLANGSASQIGDFFKQPTSYVALISYVETKFIEAEASLQTNNLPRAAAAYDTAVANSLAKFGISNPAFIKKYASETAGTINLNKIMLQKYLALYLQGEIFTDWRRTGIPKLTPSASNVTNNVIPRRYVYPISERLENPRIIFLVYHLLVLFGGMLHLKNRVFNLLK